jgi:uncharacterized protein VirK/YbjX
MRSKEVGEAKKAEEEAAKLQDLDETKRSEVVKRYKELDDALDDVNEALAKANS